MLIGLIVVIVLVVAFIVSEQRAFVHLDELCQNALSQIGVQMQSRWDALTTLAKATKGYSEHEYKTLMDVISKREAVTRTSTTDQVNNQENMLTDALNKFVAVAEGYPELKASDVYMKTMNSVEEYENNVRMSRMVYNDTVTKMNRRVRSFPSSLVANMLGFATKGYLDEPEGKTEMPDLEF